MFLFLFKIYLSIFELGYLIIQLHVGLFEIVYQWFILPPRKCVKNKLVVITGGAKGLGKELTIQFTQLGSIVAILDIDELAGHDFVNQLKSNNYQAYFFKVDVSNQKQVEQVIKDIHRQLGEIHILINNAGILNYYSITDLKPEAIERTFKVNVLAHFWTIKAVLPRMLQRKQGHIVAIASNFALLGRGCFTDYAASKFGIIGCMESLEDELRAFHKEFIKLTTICPAAIETGFSKTVESRFPKIFPIMQPDEAAALIVDVVLREQKFLTIPKGYSILYTILLRLPRRIRYLIIDYIGSSAQANRIRN